MRGRRRLQLLHHDPFGLLLLGAPTFKAEIHDRVMTEMRIRSFSFDQDLFGFILLGAFTSGQKSMTEL